MSEEKIFPGFGGRGIITSGIMVGIVAYALYHPAEADRIKLKDITYIQATKPDSSAIQYGFVNPATIDSIFCQDNDKDGKLETYISYKGQKYILKDSADVPSIKKFLHVPPRIE